MFFQKSYCRALLSVVLVFASCSGLSSSTVDPGDDDEIRRVISINDLDTDDVTLANGSTCSAINAILKIEAENKYRSFISGFEPCVYYYGEDSLGDVGIASEEASADDASGDDGSSYSEQNSQVEGVLEPDTVMTNGAMIAKIKDDGTIVLYDRVDIMDAYAGSSFHKAAVIDAIEEAGDVRFQKLILSDDRLYAFGYLEQIHDCASETCPSVYSYYTLPVVVSYDVSDPALPRALAYKRFDDMQSTFQARLREGRLMLIVSKSVGPAIDYYPDWDYETDGEQCAGEEPTAVYENAVEAHIDTMIAGLSDFDVAENLPVITSINLESENETSQSLDCGDVFFNSYSTGSRLTVVLDMGEDLSQGADIASFMDYATTIYLNQDRLIVASSLNNSIYTIQEDEDTEITASIIHLFDAGAEGLDYQASAVLPGHVPFSFAIDEDDGVVRVATEIDEINDDDNVFSDVIWTVDVAERVALSVLELDGGTLALAGQKDNIIADEDIYAARFVGDTVYLVTYRVTFIDPLFVLDTSDHHSPQVLGQLTTPGVSNYLHVLNDDKLLGVGVGTDCEDGTCWFNDSVQIALFDVSENTLPSTDDLVTIADAYSDSSWNHLAVHYDEGMSRLYVPYEKYTYQASTHRYSYANYIDMYEVSGDALDKNIEFDVDDDIGSVIRTLHFTNDDEILLVAVGNDGVEQFTVNAWEEGEEESFTIED